MGDGVTAASGAFALSFPARSSRLLSAAEVTHGGSSLVVPALWDTGATNTCVSREVAERLGLVEIGTVNVLTPTSSAVLPRYRVGITFGGGVSFNNIVVTGSEIGRQGLGVLVGMDVISYGDFAASCKDGETHFTFRVPSREHTDFTV
ncbi:MAG: retroviral-like aspartic protease family protein [Atopobiaceae bacterium]|nr:retroviral-like aspartic protease family protein [Atopobiaceae bacterium]